MTDKADMLPPGVEDQDIQAMRLDLLAVADRLRRIIEDAPNTPGSALVLDRITQLNARAFATARLLSVEGRDDIAVRVDSAPAAASLADESHDALARFEHLVDSVGTVLDAADAVLRAAPGICCQDSPGQNAVRRQEQEERGRGNDND